MTDPSKAVFLSYASQDTEAARRICDALRAAGIEVWFDQNELRGGDAWDHHIRRQIGNCALFVPIISAHTQARAEGYFRLEWDLADQRSHMIARSKAFILPACVDDTPDRGSEVPESFLNVQWTRLPGGETPPVFVERVSRLLSNEPPVSSSVGRTPAASVVPDATPRTAPPTRLAGASWRSQPALWVVAVIAIIAVAYFTVGHLTQARHSPASAQSSASTAKRAAVVPSANPEKSIAVLPFVDLSEKKDQEYFADGMAAEVIDLLAKIPGLKVIGRTSSFQFKGKSQDLRTIGSTLGAAFIVEGSVRKSGDHLRVTAQLIDARDGLQRWSSTYEQKSSDVLEVQDAIAANLARALQLTVNSDFGLRAAASSTEAYDIYLRGLHAYDQLSQEGMREAAGDFQQALDLDRTFSPAALGLAKVFQFQGEEGWAKTSIAFERARRAANLAIRLDPRNGTAHAILADILVIYDWDWAGADREVKQALDLGGRVDAIQAAARLAGVRGEWDQATQLFEKGLAADPLNSNLHELLGWVVDLRSGQFAEAESMFRRTLEISPNYGAGRWFLGISLVFQNRLDEALAIIQQEKLDDGQFEGSAIVYYAMGKKAESNAMLKRAFEHNGNSWPSAIARVHAFRGERDEAMKWLERAYSVKDEDLYVIKDDPLMKNL